MAEAHREHENRLLVVAPTARDAALTRNFMAAAGVETTICRNVDEVCQAIEAGAGAVLVTEEALAPAAFGRLRATLDRQPRWSDLPLVVLTRAGSDSPLARQALQLLGNVVLLERPVRTATLISAVQTALRGRSRQYQLRAYLAERERLLAEAEQARQAAEAAVQVRDQFLSIASHELRTPLTSLLGYATMLQARMEGGTAGDAMQQRQVAAIVRQTYRLNGLIEHLLDVSRLQRGQFVVERQVVELGALVAEAVEEFRMTLPVGGLHTIALARSDEPATVLGDPARLEEVVHNLLSNAVKYSPAGGRVAVRVAVEADGVTLEVADQGIGISAEAQARLFEPFYRAPNVSQQSSGFGIGLYLVRELVARHGGRIDVESAEGAGSRFRVVLPRQASGSVKLPRRGMTAPRP
jgi:signal transduction histidine kinase